MKRHYVQIQGGWRGLGEVEGAASYDEDAAQAVEVLEA